jgi:hypothetical protein
MANVAISGDTSGAITLSAPAVAGTNTLTLPTSTGTLAIFASSSNTTTASAGSSNVYQNIFSSIALPNKSLIIANFSATTSNGNSPSDATYSTYISTTNVSSGKVAYFDGVNTYPKSGIGGIGQTLAYVNLTGSSQNIWLSSYPYAGSGFNAPVYTVTYYIVSFA